MYYHEKRYQLLGELFSHYTASCDKMLTQNLPAHESKLTLVYIRNWTHHCPVITGSIQGLFFRLTAID